MWEEHLKGRSQGQTNPFYALATDPSLSARDRREGAQARGWEENNGFKVLNEQGHSKPAFVRTPGALARVGLLLFLAFALLQAYRLWTEAQQERLDLAAAWEPIPLRFLRQLFWISLGRVEPVGGLTRRAPEGPKREPPPGFSPTRSVQGANSQASPGGKGEYGPWLGCPALLAGRLAHLWEVESFLAFWASFDFMPFPCYTELLLVVGIEVRTSAFRAKGQRGGRSC